MKVAVGYKVGPANKAFRLSTLRTFIRGISFSYNDLGVTQSLHGNVYKVVNYEGQVTDVCHALQVELA